jgi:hypothetical protein
MSTDEQDEVESPKVGLQLHWIETGPGEEAGVAWGQLAGSINRLVLIADLLESVKSEPKVDQGRNLLELYIESYLLRAYEVRERALGLLAS